MDLLWNPACDLVPGSEKVDSNVTAAQPLWDAQGVVDCRKLPLYSHGGKWREGERVEEWPHHLHKRCDGSIKYL